MRLFLDSSALVKRYVREPGTDTVVARCKEADEIVVSVLAVPELAAAFNRMRREGKMSPQEYDATMRELAADMTEVAVTELSPLIVDGAIACLERTPLRTLDALQVASGMAAVPDIFLSADQRQCAAARQFGLSVEALS
jgi:predicted nucleic acid-binding protein